MSTELSALRKILVTAVLGVAMAASLASGFVEGFSEGFNEGLGGGATAADLNGCYAKSSASGTLEAYWFDGVSRCASYFWTPISGTVSSPGDYEVAAGTLSIVYDDGSTEGFELSVQSGGIELDGMWYDVSPDACD